VAAVDCDDDSNKAFCGTMGVQGFPTLKIVRPGKKTGKPVVEDYQGARAAKAIVDAVVEKIPNHVTKVTDKGLDGWLKEGNETAKAVLFSDKGTTSALLRALAIDYLGGVSFAQVRNKEKSTVETFGITKYPTFLVLPGGEKDAIVYDGDLKKEAMSAFITKASNVSPNPSAAPAETKEKKKKPAADKKKKQSKKPEAASGTIENDGPPTESPNPKVDVPPPVKVESPPVVHALDTEDDLQRECFSSNSRICMLAILPAKKNDILPQEAAQALTSLGEIQQKHSKRSSLPFYSVPAENPMSQAVREELKLGSDSTLEVIAVNAKRMWWRRLTSKDFSLKDLEDFVDVVRMNEGKREALPEVLIQEAPPAEPKPVKEAEPAKEKVPEPSCPHGHDKKAKADGSKPKIFKQEGLEVEVLEEWTGEIPKAEKAPEHGEL
jgi:protein disulfide-isomerase A6